MKYGNLDGTVEHVMKEQHEAHMRGVMSQWTIYNKPKDYPEGYIARRFDIDKNGPRATPASLAGGPSLDVLDILRQVFNCAGLVCLTRSPEDHESVVETWL